MLSSDCILKALLNGLSVLLPMIQNTRIFIDYLTGEVADDCFEAIR